MRWSQLAAPRAAVAGRRAHARPSPVASPTVAVSELHPAVLVTAGVAVVDGAGILLVRRADDGTWCLPGGRMEFGESVSECARREFGEETGRSVKLIDVLGVYSDPREQTHRYPDGSLVQFAAVVFRGTAGAVVGPLAGDTVEVRWFAASELPANLMACDAPIIRDALAGDRPRPIIA
jgi:ADP-ribose pyrophosphatase YjhB (NUDIX family)